MVTASASPPAQERPGSIRGVVHDRDFGTPLAGVRVTILESGRASLTSDQGNYVIADVAPGRYTLVLTKDGYVREVLADVVVAEGRLTDADASLEGEFTEMEELVVEDVVEPDAGSEAALLELRFESPALMDSISAELMSRAGASDAASALRLVAGATVQDGKSAVVRGLPDRYVSSQLNGVRLPTADEDKRAVELDQFPAAVIQSVQVSKTFTPDQQGDASGGAVDVRLEQIPDAWFFEWKSEISVNSQVHGSDFLGYRGGGVDTWGSRDADIPLDDVGESWDGAVGVSRVGTPTDHKWALTTGGTSEIGDDLRVGGLVSLFYERDSSFYDDGIDDSWWVENPGDPMTPKTFQGTVEDGDFKTALYDVTRGQQSVQWGGLAALGVGTEHHSVGLSYLYSRTAEDTATLAEDTRGKEYFFPGYDIGDPTAPGNDRDTRNTAPYIRLETLEYTERTTGSLQLHGEHVFPVDDVSLADWLTLRSPELAWTASESFADMTQPDKRQFGALWLPRSYNPGVPPFIDPFFEDPLWFNYKPDANFNLGNLQRIWKEIDEDSDQITIDATLPFEQWSGEEGALRSGVFEDQVTRHFDQDTFSNFGDSGASFEGDWTDSWSDEFPFEDHPITESLRDVDYAAEQTIAAWYAMLELPLTRTLDLIGGARFESTEIGVVNAPEEEAEWFPPGSDGAVKLNPGDADVQFEQGDTLPSIGLAYEPVETLTLRASWSETVARPTFKELTPILQQEYLGGPIFIGNPELRMSSVENHDLRADWAPYPGGLLSVSRFEKAIEDPIEYVQRIGLFDYTTAVNYPEGELDGWELEVRQQLGRLWEPLEGLAVGANATFIDSEVRLPADESADFDMANIRAPMSSRDMSNAPEHLYNFFVTYDVERTGTQLALFYTMQGDTLVAGAGQSDGNFVPSVYATEFDTLNFSLSQKLGRHFVLRFQAKNLTNPDIQTVYRSEYIGDDVLKTSFSTGVELSLSIGAQFGF